jgi:hypothetical protein
MIALRLGFRGIVRQGWGLLQVIPPMLLLFSMLTFLVATELAVGDLVKPGVTNRLIRLGLVEGYPGFGQRYTPAEINHLSSLPGVAAGGASFFDCYMDPAHRSEFTCASTSRTYLEARGEGIEKEHIDRWDKVKNGAMVSGPLASQRHWKVGDSISVFPGDYHGPSPTPLNLVITDVIPHALVPKEIWFHNEYTALTYPSWPLSYWVIWMIVDKAERRAAVMAQVDEELSALHRPHQLWTAEDTNAAILAGGATLRRSFELAGLFAFLLVVGLSTTLLIASIERRKTEFAAMLAIGFRRSVLVAIVFLESLLLLVTCSAVGAFITSWLFHDRPFKFDVVIHVTVPVSIAVMVSLGGAVLALLVALIPAWRLYRLDVLSSLR